MDILQLTYSGTHIHHMVNSMHCAQCAKRGRKNNVILSNGEKKSGFIGVDEFVQNYLLRWDRWMPSVCYFSSVALLSLRWLYLFGWHIELTDWRGQRRSLINKSALLHLSSPEYTRGGQRHYM